MKDVKKIVLTGGPCAGKTTALVRIMDYFSSRGFKVSRKSPPFFCRREWTI